MPDETATATSGIARKFSLGGRVLNRRDPRDAWMVEGYSIRGARMLLLSCGVMSMITPEEQWIEIPDDWVDPPMFPYGCAATGTSDEARRDKAAHDAADPDYQLACQRHEREMSSWRERHREPLLARLAGEEAPR